MKQIYAKRLRSEHNLSKLITLPTHKQCNQSYQLDEDYFVYNLHLSAYSNSGRAISQDIISRKRRGENLGLVGGVRSQISQIVSPDGTELNIMDASRIARITWKIVRGLFFIETNRFLPENTLMNCKNPITFGESALGIQSEYDWEQFDLIRRNPSRGQYPDIFDYKYCQVFMEEQPDEHRWFWGIWLWDRIALLICHQGI